MASLFKKLAANITAPPKIKKQPEKTPVISLPYQSPLGKRDVDLSEQSEKAENTVWQERKLEKKLQQKPAQKRTKSDWGAAATKADLEGIRQDEPEISSTLAAPMTSKSGTFTPSLQVTPPTIPIAAAGFKQTHTPEYSSTPPEGGVFGPLLTGSRNALAWAEEKVPTVDPIPAGVNEFGQPMMRDGSADPELLSRSQSGEEDPQPLDRFDMTPHENWPPTFEDGKVDIELRQTSSQPELKMAQVANDLYTRFANLRRDYAVDPVYEWTTPSSPNTPFRAEDIEQYYKVGDKVYSQSQLEEHLIPLDGGMVELPDRTVITQEQWDQAPMVYRAFPDGTVLDYADGRTPPEANRIHKVQVNATNAAGVAEPRYPWQDTAGNDPLVDPEWDPTRLVGPKESFAASADLLLGSLPYMLPKPIRYGLAAAQAAPFLSGYDSSTYEPYVEPQDDPENERPSRGLENMGQLGNGRYLAGDLTRAQMAGGFISPFVDAFVEDVSGDKFGGFEGLIAKAPGGVGKKFAQGNGYRFLAGNPLGRVLSSALMEGLEEGFSVLPGALQRDGLMNMGRESYWDDATQQVAYRGPWGKTLPKEFLQSMAAGALMGAETTGVEQLLAPLSRGYRGHAEANGYDAKPAPRRTAEELEAEERQRTSPQE